MPRMLAMARVSRKTARATQRSEPVRWSVLGLSIWLKREMIRARLSPVPAETTRSARLSATPAMPSTPPLDVVAPHRISRLVTESALPSRVPYSPGVTFTPAPSPTALTCYLARREDIREDKSDAEGTILT